MGDGLDRAGHGRVPAVIVLRRETGDEDGAAVEVAGEVGAVEQFGQREAGAFDPVLGGEIDGGEGGEAAVGGAGGDEVVGWGGDGAGGGVDFAGEEGVEGGVFGGVGLEQFGEGRGQVEGFDEGRDVCDGGGGVVLAAHFFGFGLEEGEGAVPVQGFFFFRAVVEEVHPDAHVDAHGFPGLFARLSVQHVVAHVEAVFERGEGGDGDEAGEEAVGVRVVGGGVEVV